MTAPEITPPEPAPNRRRRRWWLVGLLAVAAIAAVIGAWLDWEWWPVYSGIVITIAAIAIGIIAAVALLIPRSLSRSIGAVLGAIAIGLLLGQNLGPAREMPAVSEGSMTVALTSPEASESTHDVTCSSTSGGVNLSVSIESGRGIDLGDWVIAHVSFSAGDLWEAAYPRDDELEVWVQLVDTGPIEDDEFPTEVVMVSDSSSAITANLDGLAVSVDFDGLVRNEEYETGVGQADPVDVAGTIEFTCEAPTATP
jgi:hypothetical protein